MSSAENDSVDVTSLLNGSQILNQNGPIVLVLQAQDGSFVGTVSG